MIPAADPGPRSFRLALSGMIVLGWFAAWTLPWDIITRWNTCLFRRLTGFPCPFCYLTRSCVATAHGRLREALLFNPLGPVLMLASVVILIVVIVLLARNHPPLATTRFIERYRFIRPALIIIILVNWLAVFLRME